MKRKPVVQNLQPLQQDIFQMGSLATRQLETALAAFHTRDVAAADSVIEKDDLLDNLNLRVETNAFEAWASGNLGEGELRAARSSLKVGLNLERVGDAATHIAKRVRIMEREGITGGNFPLDMFGNLALKSVQEATSAYLREDLNLARRACEREPEIDRIYIELLGEVGRGMTADRDSIPFLLHILAVIKYLEKVGDYVLNIGEQALFLMTGRRLKFSQYQQLDYLLGGDRQTSGFSAYLDGISGAVVAKVGKEQPLVYKEGSQRKIEKELQNSETWRAIDEALIPRVLSTVTHADRQSLLREFVEGALLSQLYIERPDTQFLTAITERLAGTMAQVWRRTLIWKPPELDYLAQIRERLDETFTLHPDLRRLAAAPLRHRNTECLPLDQQLETLSVIEQQMAPAFSVWLHGDLNPNNIVYNESDDALKFIDVHRSRYGDYLQDVTVFIIGLRRQPDIAPAGRRELERYIDVFSDTVRHFASRFSDSHLDQRLALGLGRSYLTSARIILQPDHAEWLFRQGRITLQKVIDNV